MIYNTLENKSHLWGVLPWYWYFLIAIPKTLSLTIVFFPIGIYFSKEKSIDIIVKLIPILIFLSLYSFLPHKELRFIFYCFPFFNLVEAYGLAMIFRKKDKIKLIWYISILVLVASFVLSLGFLYISHYNYPGGEAFRSLHSIEDSSSNLYVHIDVRSAMTGVSRFGELNKNWRYSKRENINYNDLLSYTHLLTENKTLADKGDFYILKEIYGYQGIKLYPPQIKLESQIFIMKKKKLNNFYKIQ